MADAAKGKQKTTSDAAVAPELQKAADEAAAKGFYGTGVDPTPNENYTVAGVLAGKPTPETDRDHARAVRQELDERAHQG